MIPDTYKVLLVPIVLLVCAILLVLYQVHRAEETRSCIFSYGVATCPYGLSLYSVDETTGIVTTIVQGTTYSDGDAR